MISRDWQCLNRRCGRVFHSFEKGNPECTWCGCARVSWIPGGGHIGTKGAAVDQTVKSLATDYGMRNINTPSQSRLNRAMPKVEQPRADMPVKHFAPGFSAPVSSQGATCQVSEAAVNLYGKVGIGRPLTPSRSVPGPQTMTEFAARHAGRP
jgi:hypothetical protein